MIGRARRPLTIPPMVQDGMLALAALVDAPRLALASRAFLADRTEADFQAWREQQTWTADKHGRLQTSANARKAGRQLFS